MAKNNLFDQNHYRPNYFFPLSDTMDLRHQSSIMCYHNRGRTHTRGLQRNEETPYQPQCHWNGINKFQKSFDDIRILDVSVTDVSATKCRRNVLQKAKIVRSRSENNIMWFICCICTLALTVAKNQLPLRTLRDLCSRLIFAPVRPRLARWKHTRPQGAAGH